MIVYILSAVYAVVCWSKTAFWLFAGLMANMAIRTALTAAANRMTPGWTSRPSTVSCSYLETGKPIASGGMPSGHCQATAFFAVWMCFVVWTRTHSVPALVAAVGAGATLIGMMMRSRARVYKCHTLPQAVAGSLVGAVNSAALWMLTMR